MPACQPGSPGSPRIICMQARAAGASGRCQQPPQHRNTKHDRLAAAAVAAASGRSASGRSARRPPRLRGQQRRASWKPAAAAAAAPPAPQHQHPPARGNRQSARYIPPLCSAALLSSLSLSGIPTFHLANQEPASFALNQLSTYFDRFGQQQNRFTPRGVSKPTWHLL